MLQAPLPYGRGFHEKACPVKHSLFFAREGPQGVCPWRSTRQRLVPACGPSTICPTLDNGWNDHEKRLRAVHEAGRDCGQKLSWALTVMKFTANWRLGFRTSDGRDGIAAIPVGTTFSEAAHKALNETGRPSSAKGTVARHCDPPPMPPVEEISRVAGQGSRHPPARPGSDPGSNVREISLCLHREPVRSCQEAGFGVG